MKEDLTDSECELLGELLAYKMALDKALIGHPGLPVLRARFAVAKEQGISVALAEPARDLVQEHFERAMDEISAKLPSRIA